MNVLQTPSRRESLQQLLRDLIPHAKAAASYAYWFQFVVIAFLALEALTIIGCQIFVFLKHGVWVSFSVTRMMANTGLAWAQRPTDWRGAFILLDMLPVSLLCGSVAALWFGILFHHAFRSKNT